MKHTDVTRHRDRFRATSVISEVFDLCQRATDGLFDQHVDTGCQGGFRDRHMAVRLRSDHQGVGHSLLDEFVDRNKDLGHTEFASQWFGAISRATT
ncbi:MAG: hypothetical protein U1F83_14925 [Verrucomicrobiota bacterium]